MEGIKNMANKSTREQIVDLLVAVEKEHTYVQLLLKDGLEEIDPKERPFVTEIIYGTIKYQIKIDYIINEFSKIKTNKMKPMVRNLLRMSVYQLIHLDKVPDSAVINEAVKIIHRRKMSNLSGFVNGILRNIARNKNAVVYPSKQKDTIRYLSVVYSMPEWIVKMWCKDYGKEVTEEICIALNERAKVSVRVNLLKSTPEFVKQALEDAGIQVEQGHLLKECFYIKNTNAITNIESFNEGYWTVQDESAMLVAHVVDPKPGDKVLDVCSAPGGKTVHMAELMKNEGMVVSTDVHPHKIQLIEQTAKRMGLTCVNPTLQDGTEFKEDWHEMFDKVLLDAPCLGLGILKRKPDIRYNRSEEDVKEIVSLQKKLLSNVVKYVKPNGVLVYSTCSISKTENDDMIKHAKTLGLVLDDIMQYIPEMLKNEVKEKGYIQILPQITGTDGFFIARFRKRG
ncbi:MAG: 16S rRNA (cytosine(967)-C(5))-methyltransferase RsmB [Cellulosilyticaceae bacterium]